MKGFMWVACSTTQLFAYTSSFWKKANGSNRAAVSVHHASVASDVADTFEPAAAATGTAASTSTS